MSTTTTAVASPKVEQLPPAQEAVSGAVGTLSPHQKTMFDKFREILQKANLYNPDTHDDATLMYVLSPSLAL